MTRKGEVCTQRRAVAKLDGHLFAHVNICRGSKQALQFCLVSSCGRATNLPRMALFAAKLDNFPELFQMTAEERKRYDKSFFKLSQDRGAISPAKAASTLKKSGLPRDVLKRIWEMADVERYGARLSGSPSAYVSLCRFTPPFSCLYPLICISTKGAVSGCAAACPRQRHVVVCQKLKPR